jgi:hypothetical protein
MKHKLWYDEKADILREKIIGTFTEEDVSEYLARSRELLTGRKRRYVLVDFSEASKKLYASRKVRQMLIEGTVDLYFADEKVALLVKDPGIRLQARAMAVGSLRLGKPVQVECFEDEEEALAWLKGGGT